MNEIDYTKVLPEGLEMTMGLGLGLVLTAVMIMAILFVKRWKGRILPAFLGLVAYVVLSFVPTTLIISMFSMIPSVGEAFEYNPHAYVIVNCGLFAVTGVLARYVTSRMMVDRYEGQGDIYMSGMGVGVGGTINYIMTAISMYIWCVAIQSEGLESLLKDATLEEALSTYESIELLFVAPTMLWIIFAANAILDILMQLVLTNVTYGILKGKVATMWYALSGVITFVTMITFQMYDESSITNILVWFAVKAVLFAGSAYYVHMVVAKDIEYDKE